MQIAPFDVAGAQVGAAMGDATRPATRTGVTFEVKRLARDGDELTVSGYWSGLRGVRFVRPRLMVGDHHVLATLEHKPWTPRADRVWTAAFPWKGDVIDFNELALAVTPSITVPLCPPAEDAEPPLTLQRVAEDEPAAPPPETVVLAPKRRPAARSTTEPRASAPAKPKRRAATSSTAQPSASAPAKPTRRAATSSTAQPSASAPAKPKRRAAARSTAQSSASAPAKPERRPVAGQDDKPQAAAAERKRLQRFERELEDVAYERDALRLQLDNAQVLLAATEAERGQLEAGLLCERRAAAAAVQERDEVARACTVAERSRDVALAQRHEALLAHRALERHVQTQRAQINLVQFGGTGAEEPLGAPAMGAVQGVRAPQRPVPATSLVGMMIDGWIVRVLGTVAAACFIFLLASFTRVLM